MNQKQNKNQIYSFLSLVFLAGLFFLSNGHIARASEISSQNVIELVNLSRRYQGLDALTESSKLDAVALAKAKDMLENNYFSHNSPSGLTPWYWFEKHNYDYKYAGENLAIDFVTAEDQHEAWMESQAHRKNILNEHYREIGVAVVAGKIKEKIALLTVQVFGTETGKIYPPSENEELVGRTNSMPKLSQKQMVLSSGNFRPDNPIKSFSSNPSIAHFDLISIGWLMLLIAFLSILAVNPIVLTFSAYRLIFSNLKMYHGHSRENSYSVSRKPFQVDSTFVKFMKMKI